jgi:ankyrin repeat protein
MAFINIGFCDIETTELSAAAFNGNAAEVKRLSSSREQIEAVDSEGKTALFYAFHSGHADCSLVLMQAGAKPLDSAPAWFLIRAVQMGNLELVEKVLNLGVQASDKSGEWTALTAAALAGDCSMISFLISKGADPNQIGYEGHPPILISALKADRAAIGVLLKQGASINQVDGKGRSTLRVLSLHQQSEVSEEERNETLTYLKQNGAKFVPSLTLIEHFKMLV